MSRTLHTNSFLQLNYVLKRKKLNKRKKMIDACCDANFTKTVTECCWNVTHGRAPLSTHKIHQLKRHKALLRKLSNSSIPIKQGKNAIQRGSRFASLLPLLLGHIVAGLSRLIKENDYKNYTNPYRQIDSTRKKYQQIHLQNCLLMWNLNCYNKTRIYAPVLGNQNR